MAPLRSTEVLATAIISSVTDDREPLVPKRTTIAPIDPRRISPWLAVGALAAACFVVLGKVPEHPRNSDVILIWAHHLWTYQALILLKMLTISLQPAAIAAVWIALLRPSWSDRLLWCAVTTLTAFLIVPSIPVAFHRNDITTLALVGYTSWAAVAWYSSMQKMWRAFITGVCLAIAALAIIAPGAFGGGSAIDVAGSLVLACAIWCFSVALTQRFHIDLFAVGIIEE
jgi:hypothetical protein